MLVESFARHELLSLRAIRRVCCDSEIDCDKYLAIDPGKRDGTGAQCGVGLASNEKGNLMLVRLPLTVRWWAAGYGVPLSDNR